MILFNSFKLNGISHFFQLGHSISILRDVWWYFFVLFKLIKSSVINSGDPDQTQRSVSSDLGLNRFPLSYKKDSRLIWVSR